MNVCARQVVRLTPRRMCSHISRSLPYDGKRCGQPSGRGPNIGGMYLRRRRCRHGHPATSCSTERSRSCCKAADSSASHRLNGTVSRACAVIDASCKTTDTDFWLKSIFLQSAKSCVPYVTSQCPGVTLARLDDDSRRCLGPVSAS